MTDATRPAPPRLVLYSHDAVGLGHLRRNLAIAAAVVAAAPGADVLVVSGHHEATSFECPAGVGILTLPAIAKRGREYVPRSLGRTLAEIIKVRSAVIRAAVIEFEPDVFVVDKVACGVAGELVPTLEALSSAGTTRCVLGLRDVLDDPVTTRAEWRRAGTDAVVREHYDAVWWYGDRAVFDPIEEYDLGDAIAMRSEMTGYLAHDRPSTPSGLQADLLAQPYDLCLVGGGEDGAALARCFATAPRVDGVHRIIVTGPFMPRPIVEELAHTPGVTVVRSVPDCTDLIANARAVVTMGGYNVICELLAANVHPLIVPRVEPRLEQAIRAQRLAALGLADVLDRGSLHPTAIGDWLVDAPGPDLGARDDVIDLDGLRRVPRLVTDLADRRGTRRPRPTITTTASPVRGTHADTRAAKDDRRATA